MILTSNTDYSHKDAETYAISVALYELERYIAGNNPLIRMGSGIYIQNLAFYPTSKG